LSPVYISLDNIRGDTAQWHRVTGKYKASGEEKFLLIGSFNTGKIKRTRFTFPKDMKTPINKKSMRDAYYYIDDVSVIDVEDLAINSLAKVKLEVFPNPASKILNLNSRFSNCEYSIFDVSGRKIKYGRHSLKDEIDVEAFPAGVYFLRLKTSEGYFTSKFVKE